MGGGRSSIVAQLSENSPHQDERAVSELDVLAAGARALAAGAPLEAAVRALLNALRQRVGADAAVAWGTEQDGTVARALAIEARSPALAAELEGIAVTLAELPSRPVDRADRLPRGLRQAAERSASDAVLLAPALLGGRSVGALLVLRSSAAFEPREAELASLAADQLALLLAAAGESSRALRAETVLDLAGHVLAAGDRTAVAGELARLALAVTGARRSAVWELDGTQPLLLAAAPLEAGALGGASGVEQALASGAPVTELPYVSLPLGQPASGVLQLELQDGARAPDPEELDRLGAFAARVGHALRGAGRAQELALELERTRTLLAVVGESIAQLSLEHTLSTSADRFADLFAVPRVAAYLLDEEQRVQTAVARELRGPHVLVAARLLELALAQAGHGLVMIEDAAAEPRIAEAAALAGVGAAVALPLFAGDEVIGLLALYPEAGRSLTGDEQALLRSLGAQLAVAVQNARLHEETKRLGGEREQALAAERQAARQLRALYEISRSFAQSLSLERTLDAVAATVVELLDVDAAVIRMPDERRDALEARALSVADSRLAEPLRTILMRPLSVTSTIARVFRERTPITVRADSVALLGEPHDLLLPFLEQGSTAVILPIATPAEVLATLTLVSLDPDRQLDAQTIESALAIAGQAALAIDNARLYQQQKLFADTMQRSLLPREQPTVEGLDVGAVYESSARVDVGGDLYDYLMLDERTLAVVLGDVTGHGIDATADMAMAKFVFRSLAREHPAPGDFLAAANEVVASEVAPGKFITMLYLTVDAQRGELACAGGGHPQPRLVSPERGVTALEARGLVLGIEPGQRYDEVRRDFPPGAAVVLYTDGVVEARNESDQFGVERLDALLQESAELPAQAIADAVLAACRAHAGGELRDDCAVVVIKRL